MATITAVRWNDHIKAIYLNLLQRGKQKKLALIACARRLLIRLNGLIAGAGKHTELQHSPA
jgi:transposase